MLKPKDLPFNVGQIVEADGQPRWLTRVGPFTLELDIVEPGIASFVVMEQKQPFLDYLGFVLANSIVTITDEKEILLITAEAKGSHFAPWVWGNLERLIGNRLNDNIITLRKGEPKVYMKKPTKAVTFQSITSSKIQTLRISPLDESLLRKAIGQKVEPVFVDDFVGMAGTVTAVRRLFDEEMNLNPPKIAAVIGSDGDLYKKALDKIDITLIPQPFPLRLPTFKRSVPNGPWQINMEASNA